MAGELACKFRSSVSNPINSGSRWIRELEGKVLFPNVSDKQLNKSTWCVAPVNDPEVVVAYLLFQIMVLYIFVCTLVEE